MATSSDKTYEVHAPNSSFVGQRAGVTFGDGKGEATKAQALDLKDRGYRVPALEDEGDASQDEASQEDASQEDTGSELEKIEGIGEAYAATLAEADIEAFSAIVEADAAELAEETGLKQKDIEGWQEQAIELSES